ncbi:L,D-transpeptidase family protein [Enemella evansiae]|uniref:L,D-transpeptidase family protein n=1 Tax=Enemella evansiae TaxID=2016499 RepID=UPI0015C66FCA|nr:L,D-transpeptidase family protein [Enemella evansiae]
MKPVVSTAVGVAAVALAMALPGLAHAAPTPTPAVSTPTPGATATPRATASPSPARSASPSGTPSAAPSARVAATPAATATPTPGPTPTANPIGTPQIQALWLAEGGPAGWLGNKVGDEVAVPGGVKQVFDGGDIYYSAGTGAHWIKGTIRAKYDALGGAGSALGLPKTNEKDSSRRAGAKVQDFANGLMIWTPDNGAWGLSGKIADKYLQLDAEGGALGLPTSDEFAGRNNTRVQRFGNGLIVLNRDTNEAWSVQGSILQRYGDYGWEGGVLGRPTSDEFAGQNGARVSTFERGLIIWTPETGAHAVYGSIMTKYGAKGWEGGELGAPTSEEFDAGRDGRVQNFQNGYIIWSAATGAYAVQGRIAADYATLNWERGPLGLPISDEFDGARPGTRISRFQGGIIVYTAETDAHAVYGSIYETYGAYAWESGVLGVPATDEFGGGRGSRVQNFTGGQILWSPGTGAHAVYGRIASKFAELGWENGPLGLPLTPEFDAARETKVQNFQGGQIVFSQRTDAHAVYGSIYQTYADLGWEAGVMGPPTTDEFNGQNGARVNAFENGGIIIWTPRTGAYAVRGLMLEEYGRRGWEGGELGAPISNETPIPGGWAQDFERARLEFVDGRFNVIWPGPKVDPRCMTGRVMCISKSERKLRWMIDGKVLKEMDARFGAEATPTREAEFRVFSKVRDEVSWMYGNTPMPFAMYFSGGQAVHYSYDFAARGYAGASHGCVNIRDWDGIQWLFDTQVRIGDKVVVYW